MQDRGGKPASASFFVTVAYECWAFRRLGVLLDAESGAITGGCIATPTGPSNA